MLQRKHAREAYGVTTPEKTGRTYNKTPEIIGFVPPTESFKDSEKVLDAIPVKS